eukprot:TRINITY_DN3062_c0_g1_i1.p1 TRINITY_DN3062_c0_g1~~TRINITY_DN3062_c0_g1_i1.p1  ORF type:complete len:107 (+),score=22.76 TRINITY_DN3062_c0_g1_i1:96-416(+)
MSALRLFFRSEKWTKTVGLVGAIANWGIPLATIANFKCDPSLINEKMTGALALYSLFFMRWSLAIHPPNLALFACHVTNEAAQLYQLSRWFRHQPLPVTESSNEKK